MDRVEKKTEIEFKILASAVALDEDNRRKIFTLSEKHFLNESAKKTFKALKKIFLEYPNADESIYLSAFDGEAREAIISIMQSSLTPTLMAEQLDDTLNAFKKIVRDAEIRSEFNMLAISDDISYQTIKVLADKFEPEESGVKDNAVLYLQNYNKNTRQSQQVLN